MKMNKNNLNSLTVKIGSSLLATVLTPMLAHACACGCGVFDVGTSSMFPESASGMAFVNYDYQNQNRNWSGTGSAPAGNNNDKKIETHFVTVGVQYMFNRSWGAQLELPLANRTFDSAGNIASLNWTGLGDIRLKGIYTGFSEDMSSGLTFGMKLPTGSWNHTETLGDIDRDTQIGSGSTDILLGGFHRDRFGNSHFNWFVQGELDVPTLRTGGYRPGMEFDGAGGIYYDGFSIGRVKISPIAQIIGSTREHDSGSAAAPNDSGYRRILLSPGIELDAHPIRFYADAEFPVYQNMRGNQLVAPVLFKTGISFMF
jgi:hypothetical protein